MDSRLLGTTGLIVSRIGLGLAALGRPGYINLGRDVDLGGDRGVARMEQRCHQMLDEAYAAGIRYVDAARSYGRAEEFLASWLARRSRGSGEGGLQSRVPRDIVVGSKWGYSYTGGWQVTAAVHEVKDLSRATLDRQIGESRALLGSSLQLYQIHSATLESGVLEDSSVIDGLLRLRDEGLAIGLTVSGPRQADTIRRALAVRAGGVNPFQAIQATWNLLEVSAAPALAEAHAAGWGVIVKEPLANGRLTDRGAGIESHEAQRHAAAVNCSLDGLAIAAAVHQPWADVVLSGAVTPDQLRSNLSAIGRPEAADIPSIAMTRDIYWERRSELGWQ
jgi:aryl-alcohol dehydrogenase-like predicted oxidoreductase